MGNSRFIFDTNAFISAALIESSVNAKALDKAFLTGTVIISTATFSELTEVIFRPKFDKYFTDERRISFLDKIERGTKLCAITESITACRDPKDDKFLELAVAANAACIISGDADLLALHPFRDIPILNAADFLLKF